MKSSTLKPRIKAAFRLCLAFSYTLLLGSMVIPPKLQALPPDVSDSLNVTALVIGPPPTVQAIITTPTTRTRLATTPLVIFGTCGPMLMVRVFNNGRLAGSVLCENDGTFVMNITLDAGTNNLQAFNYDFQDQSGPDSSVVEVVVDSVTSSSSTTSSSSSSGVSSRTQTEVTASGDGSGETLFENTPWESMASLVGVGTVTSPSVNTAVNVGTGVLLAVLLIAVVGAILVRA